MLFSLTAVIYRHDEEEVFCKVALEKMYAWQFISVSNNFQQPRKKRALETNYTYRGPISWDIYPYSKF